MLKSRIFIYAAAIGTIAYWAFMSYLLETDHSIALAKQRQYIQQLSYLTAQKLSDEANSAYLLAGGMASYISMKPDITKQEFSKLAADITARKDVFRNIAGAPNLIIDNVYPLEGNEKALGLNYNNTPDQLADIQKAIETKEAILAGPINLVQGGKGFIGRFPVFYNTEGKENFWGILSIVIDTTRLYELAGLMSPDLPIKISLTRNNGTASDAIIFYGDDNIYKSDPVYSPIEIPGGEWTLAAMPVAGWLSSPPNGLIIKIFSTITLALFLLACLAIQFYINRLAHSRKIAHAANEMKSRFIANMSHEMRTPLNGILGYTSLLENCDLNDTQSAYVDSLSQAVNALLAISNDILDLAKLETGQLVLTIHTMVINHVIDEAINLNITKANDKGIFIKTHYDNTCDGLSITTDNNRLRQIISNLIDNAVKFTPTGGVSIYVTKAPMGDTLAIEISDSGIGIHQSHIQRIFERFEQVEDIYARHHTGAGLGLSICSELAQALDGKLELESALESGTRARITIPVHNKQEPSDSI